MRYFTLLWGLRFGVGANRIGKKPTNGKIAGYRGVMWHCFLSNRNVFLSNERKENMSNKTEKDVEKSYPMPDFISKLRRLADSLEKGEQF